MQAKNMSMSPEFSGFLDFVRWMAALLVVLHHWRHLWFADLADVTNKTLLIKFFYEKRRWFFAIGLFIELFESCRGLYFLRFQGKNQY